MNNANPSPASDDATGSPRHAHPQLPAELHARTLHTAERFSERPANDTLRPVGRVGIIGANGMSIGLAMGLAAADIPVTVFDERDALDQGLALLRASYTEAVTRGALTADQHHRRLALFGPAVRFHHLKDCDLIIEVMSIDATVREKFFRYLDEIGKPSAIMVANASGSRLDRIGSCTRRPSDVLGLRFSDPGILSGKARLVHARETSGEAFATAAALLTDIGKLQT